MKQISLASTFREATEQKKPLKEALRSVAYDGIVGAYRFDPVNSFSLGKASLLCVKNKRIEVQQDGG